MTSPAFLAPQFTFHPSAPPAPLLHPHRPSLLCPLRFALRSIHLPSALSLPTWLSVMSLASSSRTFMTPCTWFTSPAPIMASSWSNRPGQLSGKSTTAISDVMAATELLNGGFKLEIN